MGQKILMRVSSNHFNKTLLSWNYGNTLTDLLYLPRQIRLYPAQSNSQTYKIFCPRDAPAGEVRPKMGTLRLQKHHMVIITIPKSWPNVNDF